MPIENERGVQTNWNVPCSVPTLTALPTVAPVGVIIRLEDTGISMQWTGTAWVPLSPGGGAFVTNIQESSNGLRESGPTAINNLLESNISFPEWFSSDATRKLTHIQTVSSVIDGTWVNPLKNAGVNGEFRHLLVMNPGATGGRLTFRMIMPTAVANNTALILILDTNAATILASVSVTITQAVTDFSLDVSGLVTSHLYFAAIRLNNTGQQCNPIINRISFTPNGGTGTFAPATGFIRIGLQQNLGVGNHLSGWNSSGVYPFMNTATDFIFSGIFSTFAVEAFNNGGDGQFWTLCGGLPMQESDLIANGNMSIQDFTIPTNMQAGGRALSATVRSGIETGPVTQATRFGVGASATFPRAIYLPLNSSYSFQAPNSKARLVYSGDSVGIGAGNVDAGYQGFVIGLRDQFPGEVICESYVSQGLFNLIGPGNDPAKQKNWALYLANTKATLHIIDLSINDKANSLWPVAQFQAALLAAVTNLLAFNPQALIGIKTACITTIEGANGLGDTMPNYRTAGAAVVTAVNDIRVFLIDGLGANMPVVGDLIDTVHYGPVGLAKIREAVIIILAALSPLGPQI